MNLGYNSDIVDKKMFSSDLSGIYAYAKKFRRTEELEDSFEQFTSVKTMLPAKTCFK